MMSNANTRLFPNPTLRKKLGWLVAGASLLICAGHLCIAAVPWPAAWNPVTMYGGTKVVWDPRNEHGLGQDSLDLYGVENNPSLAALYWATNADSSGTKYLMFRMRTCGTSQQHNYAWQVWIDVDDDQPEVFDYVLVLYGQSEVVKLLYCYQGVNYNTFGTATANATKGQELWSGSAPINGTGYGRYGISEGGEGYYFYDMAIPLHEFLAKTGAEQIKVLPTTSANEQNVNKDVPLGLGLSDPIAIVNYVDPITVPEPSLTALAVGLLLCAWRAGRFLFSGHLGGEKRGLDREAA